jgi:predicted AlkP superfamily pyrophosphatase or phosphodiesterase
MKRIIILFFVVIFSLNAQQNERPKLVIGIVIDQMRYDYLYRFWDLFGEGGFKELVKNGYNCTNTHYTYLPTYTGPGHASIFSGTAPWMHGIVGNYWYDRDTKKSVYCCEDTTETAVGGTPSRGVFSPRRLLSNSISDQMRISNSFRSKTIGIAIKERSSILPAGHSANGAYWFDEILGNWVSSTYYMKELPNWAKDFNGLKRPETLLKDKWETTFPLAKYTMCSEDDSEFEGLFEGEKKPVFPHDLPQITKLLGNYRAIEDTPQGLTLTKEFAIAAIKGENLGKGEYTDMLTLSFSSTDYIGHRYGPQAIENADCYVKLDKEIKEFLAFLKTEFPKGDYLVFLTADHGASENTGYMRQNHIDCGVVDFDAYQKSAEEALRKKFNAGNDVKFIEDIKNFQFYFNYEVLNKFKTNVGEVTEIVKNELMKFPEVREVFATSELEKNSNANDPLRKKFFFGYNKKRGGDAWIVFNPAWLQGDNKGTTHGTGYEYDTHVPLIFYGMNVNKGENRNSVEIIDIAPTVANFLRIVFPNGSFGNVIDGVFKK